MGNFKPTVHPHNVKSKYTMFPSLRDAWTQQTCGLIGTADRTSAFKAVHYSESLFCTQQRLAPGSWAEKGPGSSALSKSIK